MSCKNEI